MPFDPLIGTDVSCPTCEPPDLDLAAEIREGILEAERGETVDLSGLAQYGTGDEDDEE